MMLAWPSMAWIALRPAPLARARVAAPCLRSWSRIGGSPSRRTSMGEPARQVSGRVGTAARLGEDVPVAPRRQLLPVAVGGEDLQGPGIEGQDSVAGDALGRQQHQPAAGFLQLPGDRQRGCGEVDVAPAEPGRLAPAQPGHRHQLVAGIEGFAADRGEEPGSLLGGPHRDRGPHAGLAPGGLARGRPDHRMRACGRRQLNQPGRVDGDQPFADRRIKPKLRLVRRKILRLSCGDWIVAEWACRH